jgi:hypothetical protein
MCNLLSRTDQQTGECVWQWPLIIFLWTVVNCLPMWVVIFTSKKHRPTPETMSNPKFRPFVRTDSVHWSYLMTIFTHFFFIPKLIIGWSSIFVALAGSLIASLCCLRKDERPGRRLQTVYSWFLWFGSRVPLLTLGVFWL